MNHEMKLKYGSSLFISEIKNQKSKILNPNWKKGRAWFKNIYQEKSSNLTGKLMVND
jgi:hypothetical protein